MPELVTHFLGQTAQRLQKEACTLRRDAQELLLEYHWPGNVRELENIVTRASVLAVGPAIGADELRPWLIQAGETRNSSVDSTESMSLRLEDMERKMIEATLDRYAGHRAKTAEALGIGLRTLSGKLKGYGYAPRAKSMAKAGLNAERTGNWSERVPSRASGQSAETAASSGNNCADEIMPRRIRYE